MRPVKATGDPLSQKRKKKQKEKGNSNMWNQDVTRYPVFYQTHYAQRTLPPLSQGILAAYLRQICAQAKNRLACPGVLAAQFETLSCPAPVPATCSLLKLQGLLGNFLVGTEPGKAAMSTAVPNT